MDKIRKATGKLLSLLLAAAMCLSLVPATGVTAFAASKDENAAETTAYTATLADCENGTVSFEGMKGTTNEFAEGDEVTVCFAPDEGYIPDALTLTSDESGEVTDLILAYDDEGFTFSMPAYPVTADVKFVPRDSQQYSVELEDCDGGVLTIVDEDGEPTNISEYAPGDTVIVNIQPEEGYDFTGIILTVGEATLITDESINDLTVVFDMPDEDITVGAETETEAQISTMATIEQHSANGYSVTVRLDDTVEQFTYNFGCSYTSTTTTMTITLTGDTETCTFTIGAYQEYYGVTETLAYQTIGGGDGGTTFTFQPYPVTESSGSGSNSIQVYVSATDSWDGGHKASRNPSLQGGVQDGKAHLTYGSSHKYGSSGWGTHYFSVNVDGDSNVYTGNAFCMEPSYRCTPEGSYNYATLEEGLGISSSKANNMRKALWVSAGALGYDSSYWKSVGGITDEYVLAHLLVSYIYGGAEAASYKSGVSSSALESWAEGILSSFSDVEPSGGFNVYVIDAGNTYYQYIIFWTYPCGYLTLEKSSDRPDLVASSDNYSIEGAEYTVYTDAACTTAAKDADGNDAILITDADGKTDKLEMAQGIYYVKETKASKGHDLDETVYPAEVTSSSTEDDPLVVYSVDTASPVYLTLTKSSANTSITDDNNCYDLTGAQYTVYTDSACTNQAVDFDGNKAVFTTDKNGKTETIAIPAGTYYVKETRAANAGYLLCDEKNPCENSNKGVHTVTVSAGSTESNPAVVKCSDVPGNDPLGISLCKVDAETGKSVPEGNASLDGAQFTISYYDGYYANDKDEFDTSDLPEEAKRTWVIETKKQSNGTYRAGLLDEYKVSGASFYHDEYGSAVLPLGTYTIQETLAPEGYLLEGQTRPISSSYTAPVHVGEVTLGDNVVKNLSIGNELNIGEPVQRGGVKIAKWDYELVQYDESLDDVPQGDATLAGAVFDIINDSIYSVVVDKNGNGKYDSGEEFAPGEVVMTITTEWDETEQQYIAETPENVLPYGHYIITETEAPNGYLREGVLTREFDITEEGEFVDLTDNDAGILNKVIRGGVALQKRDVQSLRDEPEGGASFEGITLEITNKSDRAVLVDGVFYDPGEVVMTVVTDADGYVETASDALPYGSYTVTEVDVPSEDGYLFGSEDHDGNDGSKKAIKQSNTSIDFEIRKNDEIVNLTGGEGSEVNADEAITDQVKRGDITLTKHNEETQEAMSVPFEVTSLTTGESHVF